MIVVKVVIDLSNCTIAEGFVYTIMEICESSWGTTSAPAYKYDEIIF